MTSNMALNLAPFGRWTLRDEAAQRRFALRRLHDTRSPRPRSTGRFSSPWMMRNSGSRVINASSSSIQERPRQMINRIIRYFDLQASSRGDAKFQGRDAGSPRADLTVFPQYVALVLGILVQPYFEKYRATGSWAFSQSAAIGWLVFAAITGLVVFPSVYRRAFDAGQPKFVQFCDIFAGGMGWKALLDTAVKVGQSAA